MPCIFADAVHLLTHWAIKAVPGLVVVERSSAEFTDPILPFPVEGIIFQVGSHLFLFQKLVVFI